MPRRAVVAINRASRRGGEDHAAVFEVLRAAGIEAVEVPCAAIADLAPSADLVVVGGGDGTLNRVLEGVLAAGRPLGVVPLGTGNDFARTLGLPLEAAAAAAVVAAGRTRRVDVGVVNGRPFLNVASMGLSVEVARVLDRSGLKRRWGQLGYALGAVAAVRRARPFRARIRCDGHLLKLPVLQVAVGNGRHFGGGMTVAEGARIDDGRLDVFTVGIAAPWRLAALGLLMRRGRQGRLDEVHVLSGHDIEVVTERPLAINADGEIVARTPGRFRVLPRALDVFVPAEA